MKQTKFIGMILGLFLLAVVCQPVRALVPLVNTSNLKTIQLVPSPTPTLSLIKLGNLHLIATATPTLALIKLPGKLKPIVTLAPTITPTTIKVSPTASQLGGQATVTADPTVGHAGSNMTFWFLMATVGLLVVIIVVQAWPKKDIEE
jgi:hypothetical protein